MFDGPTLNCGWLLHLAEFSEEFRIAACQLVHNHRAVLLRDSVENRTHLVSPSLTASRPGCDHLTVFFKITVASLP